MRLNPFSVEAVLHPETVISGVVVTGLYRVLVEGLVVILLRQLLDIWQDVLLVILVDLECRE